METALGAAGLPGKARVLDVDTRGALGRVQIDL
jgi:hypothetical protein